MSSTTAAPDEVHEVVHLGVGIDTARYGHRVTFLRADRQPAAPAITVTEDREGFEQLRQELERLQGRYPGAHFHVHVDAAGQYAANLERFLRALALPITLSVGEPKRNKDYRQAFFPKRTSDDTESQAMARFGVVEQPAATPEVPDMHFALREIVSRLQASVRDTTRAINRLHNVLARVFPELATLVIHLDVFWLIRLLKKYPTPAKLAAARLSSLEKIPFLRKARAKQLHEAAQQSVGSFRGALAEALVRECVEQLAHCLNSQKRLEKLLLQAFDALPASGHVHVASVPGIGPTTAAVLVAKMVSIDRFQTPDDVVGYFGTFPEENTSGVDRRGKKIPPGTMRMSSKGSDVVRRYLWNAAKTATQCNPAVRELYARLRAKGTRGDVALGHCMRKLLHQVFAVWAGNTPYDEQKACPRCRPPQLSPPATPHDAGPPSATETAAGHKRDVLPDSKVVTAATTSVGSSPAAVNPTAASASAGGTVDFAFLRQQISIQRVLAHWGCWQRLRGSGDERRGPCPLHDPAGEGKRRFSVNLRKNVFRCFDPACGQTGNVLDLWAALHGLPVYEAALHLAETFQLATTPEQRRGARNPAPQTASTTRQKPGVMTPDAT